MAEQNKVISEKKTQPLIYDSIFDREINSCKLWTKPTIQEAQDLNHLSPFISKSAFLKKGKMFGIWTERMFYLHRDYLFYKKVSNFGIFNP